MINVYLYVIYIEVCKWLSEKQAYRAHGGVQPKTEKNIAVQLAPSSCDLKMIFYMICTLQFLFVSLILVTIKS